MAAGHDPFIYSKALVLGASEARDLGELMAANRPPFHHNFGFDNNQVQVSVYGVGGRTVRKTGAFDMGIVDSFEPDIVVLTVGGNDLAFSEHWGRPEVVGHSLLLLAERLHEEFDVARVVVPSLGPRFKPYGNWSYPDDYLKKVDICNQYLQVVLDDAQFASFWNNNKHFQWGQHLFNPDGVHFNSTGQKLWYKSLRGSLVQAFRGK